jgi:hypothetical protein
MSSLVGTTSGLSRVLSLVSAGRNCTWPSPDVDITLSCTSPFPLRGGLQACAYWIYSGNSRLQFRLQLVVPRELTESGNCFVGLRKEGPRAFSTQL